MNEVFIKLINNGWKIELCACSCGGKYAWLKQRDSGAYEIHGCVCHNTPLDISLVN